MRYHQEGRGECLSARHSLVRVLILIKVYLCDSGAQFLDGTTDVTRTWVSYQWPSSSYKVSLGLRVALWQPDGGREAVLHPGSAGPYRHRYCYIPYWHYRLRDVSPLQRMYPTVWVDSGLAIPGQGDICGKMDLVRNPWCSREM